MNGSENIEIVWKSLSSGLKTFIIARVRNENDADDILQDVYIKIHENIDTLKDKSKLQQWIYQISRNLIIDYFRKTGRQLKNNKEMELLIPESTVPGKFMNEAISDMIKMMDKLPPEYCEALCLTELEGMSQKAYARMAGLSYSGAKSRVQRARAMLKDLLMRCCHYHFDKYGTVLAIHPAGCCCCKQE